jgi:hypothetical protein
MKARKRIDGASYAPEVVHALGEAFEQAWKEIAGNFGNDPSRIDAARMRLADAILSVAPETSTNVKALKTGALEAMAGVHRSPVRSRPKPDTQLGTR